jgi:hypothetical protein
MEVTVRNFEQGVASLLQWRCKILTNLKVADRLFAFVAMGLLRSLCLFRLGPPNSATMPVCDLVRQW